METTAHQARVELDLDDLGCSAVGMALAAFLVAVSFALSVVSVSLMKKGIPETMNTFVESAQSTFARLSDAGLARLVEDPEDMGFQLARRLPTITDAIGEYIPDDLRSVIQVSGANLDRVSSISIGGEPFSTESFRYDTVLGVINLTLRREPKTLGDILTVSDDAGERAERSIRWPTDANLAGPHVGVRVATGSKPPAQPSTSAAAAEAARLHERLARLAPLKEAVVDILQEHALKLDIQTERQFLEETFEGNSNSLFLKLVSTVIEAKTLTPQARIAALRKLLRTQLFRTRFLDLSEAQLAWLLAAGNDRIVQVLWDPNGAGASLRGLHGTTAATQTTAAATVTTATAALPAQYTNLRPSDYRQVFRAEEPYRDCLANQAKLLAAVQAAEGRGELEAGADMAWLVRKNFLQTTLLCPAGGQYSIEPAGAGQEIACTVHGSASAPSDEHRKFAALFSTYEKARNLIAREGGSAEAIPLLEAEHEKQPFNPYVSFLLGRAFIETQNYDRAAQLLKPLSDEKDSNAAFAFHCGYAFYAIGNAAQAEVMFSRVLSSKVEDSYEASREEVSSHAEFYLLRDRARWAARNALGRDLVSADDGPESPADKRPMRFLDFKQMSEPEYPSQVCLRGLLDFEKALGPVLENFMQPEMRDRWASLFQKYAAGKGPAELKELLDYLRSLAKEYSGLFPDEPPPCPEKGFIHLQATAARVLLQCSVHRDLEPDAQVNLPPTTPAWQLHAINDLLIFMLRLKNPRFDQCLTNQEKIEAAFTAWDDPRRVPDLDDLVTAKKIGQKTVSCPASRTALYRLGHDGQVSCRLHPAFRQVERRLAAWPLMGGR